MTPDLSGLRPLLLQTFAAAVVLSLFADGAGAQMEFAGIAYGTPARETASRLEAMGYRLRGVDQDGDWVFRGPDGSELVAVMDPAGLVDVEQAWTRPPQALPDRFRRMADSLLSVLGDTQERGDHYFIWRGADRKVSLSHFQPPHPNGARIRMYHVGPRSSDEFLRRDGVWRAARERPGSGAVEEWWGPSTGSQSHWMFRVDTASAVAVGTGVYRVRLRHMWTEGVLRLHDARKYTDIYVYADMDCTTSRLRRHRAFLAYQGLPVPGTELREGLGEWYRPEPGTLEASLFPYGCTLVEAHLATRDGQ